MLILHVYLYYSRGPLCERLREDEVYLLLKSTLLFNLPLRFLASDQAAHSFSINFIMLIFVMLIFKNRQEWSFHNLSGQLAPWFDCFLFCKYFSYNLIVISHIATCVCCLFSLCCVSIIVFFYKFPLGN